MQWIQSCSWLHGLHLSEADIEDLVGQQYQWNLAKKYLRSLQKTLQLFVHKDQKTRRDEPL